MEQLRQLRHEFENFAYIVSHDLQAPLRVVVSFAKLLQERYQGTFDEKGNKHFNYIINGAEQLQQMVEGLLCYSRINTQEVLVTAVPLSEIIGRAHILCEGRIAASDASLRVTGSFPQVMCNAEQVAQVLAALIDNAIKFQPVGKKPEIWVDAVLQEDGYCLVSVQDNGIGIEGSKCQEIFNVFRQLNKPLEYKGIGMGLAIAKNIIVHHGGKIWVTSEPGQGSAFYFTLPGASA